MRVFRILESFLEIILESNLLIVLMFMFLDQFYWQPKMGCHNKIKKKNLFSTQKNTRKINLIIYKLKHH